MTALPTKIWALFATDVTDDGDDAEYLEPRLLGWWLEKPDAWTLQRHFNVSTENGSGRRLAEIAKGDEPLYLWGQDYELKQIEEGFL
jgi:hypothetical protein